MKKVPLHWQIIIALILGVLYAVISSFIGLADFNKLWVSPWGRIFISLLKLIAVPLVLFSIMGGIVSLGDPRQLGKMGTKTLSIYLITTVVAVSVGLAVANFVAPGEKINEAMRLENRISYELWAASNKIELHDKQCVTCMDENKELVAKVQARMSSLPQNAEIALTPTANNGPLNFVEELVPSNIFGALADNRSMLKVIFFAVFFGVCILFVPVSRTTALVQVITSLSDVFIKMVEMVMKAAPFFVFALMAGVVSEQAGDNPGRVLELFKGLGWYTVSVLAGLGFVTFVLYPTIIHFFVKGISFKQFLKGISPAQLLAFSTSSSAATLPVTLECVEKNLGVDKRVASFVLPIGSTVNMDGTSLFQAVAVLFLAQYHGIQLDLVQQITIVLTATMASIGAAAIPGAGVVMLMVVLTSVGLNPAWIALILPVDRILDMFRTIVNVTGDTVVCLFVERTSSLPPVDNKELEMN
jgi:Na+/H+-dicarboxylate symporter